MMWPLERTSFRCVNTVSKPEACQMLGEGSDTGEFNRMRGFHFEIYLCSEPKAFFFSCGIRGINTSISLIKTVVHRNL